MSNRSGTTYSAPTDADRRPVMLGVSTVDGITPVPLEVNPVNGQLQTSSSGGGGGGTQYQELATTSPATGTLALGRYVSSLPTLTNGQMNEPLLDASSRLLTTETNSSTIATNTGNSATSANQTNGTQQTKLTDGTNIANVLASGTPNATGNALLTASMTMPVTFTTTTAQAVASTDAGNYKWVSVQTSAIGTSSVQNFQGSNDNTNWVPVWLFPPNGTGAATSSNATGIFSGPLNYRYFRINVTGIAGGTTSGTVVFSSLPSVNAGNFTTASQSGTWSIGSNSATGSAVPANAFYMGIRNGSSNLTGVGAAAAVIDADPGSGTLSSMNMVYNGSTFDRTRSANASSNTTGTGLLGAGELVYDGTNWQKAISIASTSGVQAVGINDGTNTANVVAGDSGFNGVATTAGGKTYTFTTSSSGAQTLLANTPTEGYTWIDIVYTSVGVGLALTGQYSATSGGTYVSPGNIWTSSNSAAAALGTAANTIYSAPIRGNFFQLVLTALTSGTFSGFVTLRANAPGSTGVNANVSGSVGSNSATGSAVPANAFMAGMSDGTNLQALRSNLADATGASQVLRVGYMTYNGATFDIGRSATAAANTTGTGLLGVGLLEWDGTNYQRVPSARFAPSTTKLNTNSYHITTNTTNTPTSSTAYISSIAISAEVGGTTSSITIQDKQGTPLKLVNGLATTAVSTTPTVLSFQTPVLMTSGIDIITSGAVAGTVDVWINWFQ